MIVIMTNTAASNITIDDIKLRMDALLNRFMKSSIFVFSIVNVDVTVLVAVVDPALQSSQDLILSGNKSRSRPITTKVGTSFTSPMAIKIEARSYSLFSRSSGNSLTSLNISRNLFAISAPSKFTTAFHPTGGRLVPRHRAIYAAITLSLQSFIRRSFSSISFLSFSVFASSSLFSRFLSAIKIPSPTCKARLCFLQIAFDVSLIA